MSEETLLFVGGPADGKWITVPMGIPYWRIMAPQPLPAAFDSDERVTNIQVDTVDYRREVLASASGARFSVMCVDSESESLIERLIKGYNPVHDESMTRTP